MPSGFRVSGIHFPAAPPTLELRSPAHEDDLPAGLILHPGEHLSPIVDPLNGPRVPGCSALAGGTNPRAGRRGASVLSMFVGAALGALLVRHSLVLPLVVSGVVSSSCALVVALTPPYRAPSP